MGLGIFLLFVTGLVQPLTFTALVPHCGNTTLRDVLSGSHLLSMRHTGKSFIINEGGPEAHPTGGVIGKAIRHWGDGVALQPFGAAGEGVDGPVFGSADGSRG